MVVRDRGKEEQKRKKNGKDRKTRRRERWLCTELSSAGIITGLYAKIAFCLVIVFLLTLKAWNSMVVKPQSGLHLEIDPRGGEMSIYEKEGGRSPVYMRG